MVVCWIFLLSLFFPLPLLPFPFLSLFISFLALSFIFVSSSQKKKNAHQKKSPLDTALLDKPKKKKQSNRIDTHTCCIIKKLTFLVTFLFTFVLFAK